MVGAEDALVTNRVLIDMSNLRTGGGLQVGASFGDELAQIRSSGDPRWPWLQSAVVLVSERLVANAPVLASTGGYEVVESSPLRRLIRPRCPSEFDVSFHVFGPDYGWRRARRRICGFADVTSLSPRRLAGSTAATAKLALRGRVSKQRFSRCDRLVVESRSTARRLDERWGVDAGKISVVSNVPNALLSASDQALHVAKGRTSSQRGASGPFVFGYPTRAYPHKNLGMIGAACELLRKTNGVHAVFRLTLTDDEWDGLDPLTRAYSENVGPLRVEQLPDFYSDVDAVGFLSLDECFSVTPLEAMLFGRPLLASDRDFVREVTGAAAWYCEPTDARSVASAMLTLCQESADSDQRAATARRLIAEFPTARDRAERYLDLIDRELGNAR